MSSSNAELWRDLSVLIVGCGSAGRRHGRVLAGLGLRNIRACDPSQSQRSAFAKDVPRAALHGSYEAGLEGEPDAVLICTPPGMHIAHIRAALNAGCHVLCEKPLSDATDGIDQIEALAREKKLRVMVAQTSVANRCLNATRSHQSPVANRRLSATRSRVSRG